MKISLTLILICTTLVCNATTNKVTRIIDGDTFEIDTGEKVRLIGINAPELSDIFGQQAKQHLANLIYQKTIDLLPDKNSNDRDKYSRLLRYVILNGKDINKQMLLDGFATAYLKYHFSKAEEYRQAQLSATNENVGIWGSRKEAETPKQLTINESTSHSFSAKGYFIAVVVLLLIGIGIYFRFKK